MDISIVIVNWNTRDLLHDCLETVFAGLGALSAEVIVVDNASGDESVAMMAAQFPSVQVIASPQNVGFAAGNNLGFARATGRYILLLNTDTLVLGDVLPAMAAFMDANPQVGVMGPRVLNTDRSTQNSATGYPSLGRLALQTLGLDRFAAFDSYRMTRWDRRDQRAVQVISGCAMMVRAAAMRAVGPLDSDFFFFGEETDWCRRFAMGGWQIMFAPVGEIVHFGGGSVRKLHHTRDIMLTEGTVRLHRKHGGLLAGLACYGVLFAFNLSRALLWSAATLVKGTSARARARHFWGVVAGFATAWPKART